MDFLAAFVISAEVPCPGTIVLANTVLLFPQKSVCCY